MNGVASALLDTGLGPPAKFRRHKVYVFLEEETPGVLYQGCFLFRLWVVLCQCPYSVQGGGQPIMTGLERRPGEVFVFGEVLRLVL